MIPPPPPSCPFSSSLSPLSFRSADFCCKPLLACPRHCWKIGQAGRDLWGSGGGACEPRDLSHVTASYTQSLGESWVERLHRKRSKWHCRDREVVWYRAQESGGEYVAAGRGAHPCTWGSWWAGTACRASKCGLRRALPSLLDKLHAGHVVHQQVQNLRHIMEGPTAEAQAFTCRRGGKPTASPQSSCNSRRSAGPWPRTQPSSGAGPSRVAQLSLPSPCRNFHCGLHRL